MRHYRLKAIVSLIALTVSLTALLTQRSLAYYAVLGEATNVITSGEIELQIIEKMGDQDFPTGGVHIMPGSLVSKQVTVANVGINPFWVRIKLAARIDDAVLSADILEYDLDLTDWIDGKDGYYYYREILQPGAQTGKLLNQVRVSGDVDNAYLGHTVKLAVTASAVQSEYNGADSPLDVAGWPAEE